MFFRKGIIDFIQNNLLVFNDLITSSLHLCFNDIFQSLCDFQIVSNFFFILICRFFLNENRVFSKIDLVINDGIGEVFDIIRCWKHYFFINIKFNFFIVVFTCNFLYSVLQLNFEIYFIWDTNNPVTKGPAFLGHFTQNHLRIFHKILIVVQSFLIASQVNPRLIPIPNAISFLQKDDIARYFCAGLPFKGSIWQSYRSNKLRTCSKIPSNTLIFLIKCSTGSNEGNHTTISNLV